MGKRTLRWSALVLLIPLAMPVVGAWDAATSAPALQPLVLDMTGWTDRTTAWNADLPLPAAAAGIGPGSHLLITQAGGTSGCTANFVWSGTNGQTYLGSAGHCFLPDGATATHGPGADYDPTNTIVRVCVANCILGGETSRVLGSAISNAPDVIAGTLATLGPVAYARATGVGHDFGVVEIPSNLTSLVRPSMPVWGGPVGATTVTNGKVLCHYGNGAGVGEVFPTMARVARGTGADAESFRMTAASSPGDSGSAVEACGIDPGGVHGQGAVGILTHLDSRVSPQAPSSIAGFVAGTTVAQAAAMATEAGLTIGVVDGV